MKEWLSVLLSVLVVTGSSLVGVGSVHGAVLHQKRSGVVVVRESCKKKETPLDLAQFGAVGPKGDKGDPGPIEGVLLET